ncbi:MAG: VCBS repeat-containing protein [Bacteroidota bacterium]
MKKLNHPGLLLFLLACFLGCVQETSIQEDTLFSKLSPKTTNIHFENRMAEDERLNVYSYVNAYNGGGVAIGDINNDGLSDIFFTGNMTPNKLYLNKGDMTFEDISVSAGIEAKDTWCSGVTMADVNSDGAIDIYVCRAWSEDDPDLRRNLLFINNKDNTFTESGAQYGVDDPGFASQASFFDFDLDGDLDLFVGNFPREFISNTYQRAENRNNPDLEWSDKLYRNNGNGTFTDITEAAGVANYGWTLGIMTSDFNMDGLPDIFVAVDHDEPDYAYINNGDGTFTNDIYNAFRHISTFSMGLDIADINNDGLLDVFVLDMLAEDYYRQKALMAGMAPAKFWALVNLGYHYQYMRNVLQLNNGNGTFSDIAYYSGVTSTDWSWASLLADFDNDGLKDLYVTNGYKREMKDNDFLLKVGRMYQEVDAGTRQPPSSYEITKMAKDTFRLPNYYFKNKGKLKFEKHSKAAGLDHLSLSNGAAYGDLDNDGDLDLVVNNLFDPAFIYRNNSQATENANFLRIKLSGPESNKDALGAKIKLLHNGQQQVAEKTLTRGFQSSVENIIHFGLGQETSVQKLEITWPDGLVSIIENINANQLLEVSYSEAEKAKPQPSPKEALRFAKQSPAEVLSTVFKHTENPFNDYEREVLLPHMLSRLGPFISSGDANGDGLEDFYIGGAIDQAGSLYIQQQGGKFTPSSGPWEADAAYEDMGSLFLDFDQDGDEDLFVISGGNEYAAGNPYQADRVYVNSGNGKFTKSTDVLPQNLLQSGSCIINTDIDKDGDMDLFIGGRQAPSNYPYPGKSFLLINEDGKFIDKTNELAPELSHIGMVTSAIFSDYDNDSDKDLIVVGEWMPITFFENQGGQFVNRTNEKGFGETQGWWNDIAEIDLNNDGNLDYVAGNLGLNYKYKAKPDAPFEIFTKDFDANGRLDIVLGQYYGETLYPVRGLQCSSEQMPLLGNKFPTYGAFATSNLEDIYGEENLKNALNYSAKTFSSAVIINDGNGGFSMKDLPYQAQLFPVNGILATDINNDGNQDLILTGNQYSSEVETGRADAGNGLVLTSNGNGHFDVLDHNASGFFSPFDAKDLALIKVSDGHLVIVANNNGFPQVFSLKTQLQ